MQVVVFHFGAGFSRRHHFPSPVQQLLDNGWVAVALFFILSGFILSYTYADAISGGHNRARFWIARFARVYPVYLLSLLLDLTFTEAPLRVKLAALAMVQSWNPLHPEWCGQWNMPTWTLSCEAFFYLVLPFLLPATVKLSDRFLQLFSAALILLIMIGHTMTNWPAAWLFPNVVPLPIMRLPEFLLGTFTGTLFVRKRRLPFSAVTASLALLAMIVIEVALSGPWISLLVLPYIFLIFALAQGSGIWARLLNTRLLLFLGAASYAVYLLQMPVRHWTHFFLSQHSRIDGIDTFISPLILIALSAIVYKYWEEPARVWIRKISDSSKRSRLPIRIESLRSPEKT